MATSMRVAALLAAAALAASSASAQYATLHAFSGEGGAPQSKMLHSSDERLYGTTSMGCIDGVGSVFAMVPDGLGGYGYKLIGCFSRTDPGHNPLGGVVEGSDGALYGTTSKGGPDDAGAVFRMTKSGELSFLHVFHTADGREPHGELVLASDGAFYGTTALGGDNDYGTVFRIESNGTFASLHSFDGQHGQQPMAGLVQASNGDLYGTTYLSTDVGTGGVVYRITTAGEFTSLQTFSYPYWYPRGPLAQMSDGKLYGTTSTTAFRIAMDGSAFEHISYQVPGGTAGLEEGVDGFLYGTADYSVFRLSPVNFNISTVHAFDALAGTPSTLIEMSDYGFIGTCPGSGQFGDGFVFRIYPWGQYQVLHDFPVAPEGSRPSGALTRGADGALYGVTSPQNYAGTIFQVTARGGFRTLRHLAAADGLRPIGGMVNGSDGAFYGVTGSAGGNGFGTGFRMEAGGGYTVLHDFDEGTGRPDSALGSASDGTFLGTTTRYDPGQYGILYRLHTDGQLDPVYAFTSFDGFSGHTRPLEASDGSIVGTAPNGGADGYGSVFRWDSLNGFLLLHDFFAPPPAGYLPSSGLIEPFGGTFFGTSTAGGSGDGGTVYTVDTDGNVNFIHDFAANDGAQPLSELLEAYDGKLYGVTTEYGASDNGTIFRIDTLGGFEKLHDFAPEEGSAPEGPLVRGADGAFYGGLSEGGAHGNGAVFRFAVPELLSVQGLTPDSGPAAGGTPVVVGGTHFLAGATASIGGAAAGGSVDDEQHISSMSPAATPGSISAVVVANAGGETVTLLDGWFADFADVDGAHPFHDFIESIVRAGITAGCGGGNYCPDASVTRAQMAVFLLKAEHGPAYAPPACQGVFADAPCPGPFTDWIEQLASEDITGGCGGGNYCPASAVTRAQMAIFLLKTLLGSSYTPPPAIGLFGDVPPGSFAADWIEDLYGRQITGGCSTSPLLFCPNNANTRGQMAVFLTKTFSLP